MMRLAEEKLKQGILHPDPEVREMAVGHFAESFSQDPTIMPLVIQAVEKYGWQDGINGHALRNGLIQTDDTLAWMLRELAREGDSTDSQWERYYGGLFDLLMQTDASLLAEHQATISDIEGLEVSVREAVMERIQLLSADPDTCWVAVEDFCEREKSKHYINEVNLAHAYRLVEAVARHGEAYAGRVLNILAEEIEDVTNHPMAWLEPLVVRLAGEMRLATAIPLLVKKVAVHGVMECDRTAAD